MRDRFRTYAVTRFYKSGATSLQGSEYSQFILIAMHLTPQHRMELDKRKAKKEYDQVSLSPFIRPFDSLMLRASHVRTIPAKWNLLSIIFGQKIVRTVTVDERQKCIWSRHSSINVTIGLLR